jgi:chromosome segregation ATPase
VKEDEYYRMLEVVGLKRKSSNNIILQGKIDQITQLSEKGLFDLLKNLIGSDKYDDKEEASRDIIGKTAPEEEKSKKLLDNFFEKLNDLTSDKEEYEQFLETEKLVQTLKHIVYRRNYDTCFKKSIKDNEKAEAIRRDLLEIFDVENGIRNTISDHRAQIEKIKEQVNVYDQNTSSLTATTKVKLQGESELAQKFGEEFSSGAKGNISFYFNNSAEKKTLPEMTKELGGLEDKILVNKNLFEKKESEFNSKKVSYKVIAQSILANDEFFSLNQDPATFKLRTTEKIQNLQHHLQEKQKTISSLDAEVSEAKANIAEIRKNLTAAETSFLSPQQEYMNTISDLVQKEQEKSKIVEQLEITAVEINQLNYEHKENQNLLSSSEATLDRLYQDQNLAGLRKLLDVARERGIEGVHGLLIDLIKINGAMVLYFDIVLKAKIFAVVVENMDTAGALINLNKELGGGKILFFPLSLSAEYENEIIAAVDDPDAILLRVNFEIKEEFKNVNLTPVLNHVLKNSMVVKDYKTALELSGTYHSTCVTPQGEVVFPGSFLTKCGYFDCSVNRIELYWKYVGQRDQWLASEKGLSGKKSDHMKLKDNNLAVLRKIQEFIIKKEGLEKSVIMQKNDVLDYKNALVQAAKALCENDQILTEYRNDLDSIEKELSHLQKDLELGKPSTEIKKVNLDKQKKEMKLLVEEISNLGAKLQEVKSSGVKLRSDKDFLLGAANKAEMNKKLEKLNDQNENLVKNAQSEAIHKIKYREKMRKGYQPDLDQALKGIDTLVVKILDAEKNLQEAIEQKTEKEKELKKVNARTAYSNDESERLNYKMKDCQLDPEIEKQYLAKSTPDIFSNLKEIVQERRSYTEQDKI